MQANVAQLLQHCLMQLIYECEEHISRVHKTPSQHFLVFQLHVRLAGKSEVAKKDIQASPQQRAGYLLCTVYPWWGFSTKSRKYSRGYLCWCQGPDANHVMAQVP